MDEKTAFITISTRLPQDLYDKFFSLCASEHRSMSAQLLRLIEQHVENEKNTPSSD